MLCLNYKVSFRARTKEFSFLISKNHRDSTVPASFGLADQPLHFSRFFPRFKMQDIPPTPVLTLKAAKQIAEEEGICHVYLGNVSL